MEKANKELIVKSNELINATLKEMSTQELKILSIAIAQLNQSSDTFQTSKIYIREFLEKTNSESNSLYERAKGITFKLLSRVVERPSDNNGNVIQHHIFSECKYDTDEKGRHLLIEFHKQMKPFLLQLKRRFTLYDIQNILNLRSAHSIRVYELLKQYEDLGSRIISLSELKRILNLTSKAYDRYFNIKTRVLLPAQSDLKEYCDLYFEFNDTNYKVGKKVDKIEFTIYRQQPPFLKLESPAINVVAKDTKQKKQIMELSEAHQKIIERLVRDCGLTMREAIALTQDIHLVDAINGKIDYILNKKKNIADLPAYTKQTIRQTAGVQQILFN